MNPQSDGPTFTVVTEPTSNPPLCASCDRCRARKTKCDGARPCGNCTAKYLKKNKLESIDGLDVSIFDCVYSPAKRRGPIPGRTNSRKSNANKVKDTKVAAPQAADEKPVTTDDIPDESNCVPEIDMIDNVDDTAEDILQQHLDEFGSLGPGDIAALEDSLEHQKIPDHDECNPLIHQMDTDTSDQPSSQRKRFENATPDPSTIVQTVDKFSHLLNPNSIEGITLRSYYTLSIDELFHLPPIPTDNDYAVRCELPPPPLPTSDAAVLKGARFSEIALGALVNDQVPLALQLSNATVLCLKDCALEDITSGGRYEMARAYMLHALFRGYRGDVVRYFKYRRICLSHLSKLDNVEGVEALFSALSIIDAWAYMIYNAEESKLPHIDDTIAPLKQSGEEKSKDEKYGICTMPSSIATSPDNQMWIQGPPPVFINNKAPPACRSLDALACAMRSCCDQANSQFEGMARQMNNQPPESGISLTPTATAVTANQNELCSRNMVLSAFTLLQLHEATTNSAKKNHAHHLLVSAMDAFLDEGDEGGESGGFTESQIQSLMSVCNTVIEHPSLLYMAGPTYHMITNAIILFCHLLNGMHANRLTEIGSDMEKALFDEVLDTFISVRKLLMAHRMKLPLKLRCHSIPRPNFKAGPTDAYIDLGETVMCAGRGCQGFVLMACSPCVAAERVMAAKIAQEFMEANEEEAKDHDFDPEFTSFGKQYDYDDDALLSVLSQIIGN